MSKRNFLFFFTLVICSFSCSLLENELPIPFYIDLKSPSVRQPVANAFDTHKINEVWVFADGQILGVFPLPAKVPVFFSGNSIEITILAGIRNNGMNETPVFYPFYKSIIATINPKENEVISIPLEFQYIANAKIPVNESFEAGSCFTIDLDGKPEPYFDISNQISSIGYKSAVITLTSSNRIMEIGCINKIKRGDNSRGQSYVELDYKGEGEIAIGIAKNINNITRIEYVIYIPGKENWNKIYVDLTDKLSSSDYDEYFIVLGANKTGNSLESKIYIDNVKHLHF